MSLTPCADCGREISSLAPACIHCGRPAPQSSVPPASPPAPAAGTVGCPLCGARITHSSARTGGATWCEQCGAQLVFGTDGALVRATPRAPEPQRQPVTQVVVVADRKSVGVAILLTLLFGPLGMLYSTIGGAVIMCLVTFFVAAVTFGLGLFVTWPICVIWAAYAASEHNRRLTYGVNVA